MEESCQHGLKNRSSHYYVEQRKRGHFNRDQEHACATGQYDGRREKNDSFDDQNNTKPVLMVIVKWCIVGVKEWFQLQEIAHDETVVDFVEILPK